MQWFVKYIGFVMEKFGQFSVIFPVFGQPSNIYFNIPKVNVYTQKDNFFGFHKTCSLARFHLAFGSSIWEGWEVGILLMSAIFKGGSGQMTKKKKQKKQKSKNNYFLSKL